MGKNHVKWVKGVSLNPFKENSCACLIATEKQQLEEKKMLQTAMKSWGLTANLSDFSVKLCTFNKLQQFLNLSQYTGGKKQSAVLPVK